MENILILNYSGNIVKGVKDKTVTHITIPRSVTTIEGSAFSECTALKSIDIPNSVTTIGAHAFYKCTALQSIDIPNSVTLIGDRKSTRLNSSHA